MAKLSVFSAVMWGLSLNLFPSPGAGSGDVIDGMCGVNGTVEGLRVYAGMSSVAMYAEFCSSVSSNRLLMLRCWSG